MAKEIRPGVWATHYEKDLDSKKRDIPPCDTPGPRSARPGHGTQRKATWALHRHDGGMLAAACDECVDAFASMFERRAA
jgi:hypothetical protein